MVFVVSRISALAAPLGSEYPGTPGEHPGTRNLTGLPAKAPATASAAPLGPEYPGARRTPLGTRRHPRRPQPYGFASKSASAPATAPAALGDTPGHDEQHRPRRSRRAPNGT